MKDSIAKKIIQEIVNKFPEHQVVFDGSTISLVDAKPEENDTVYQLVESRKFLLEHPKAPRRWSTLVKTKKSF